MKIHQFHPQRLLTPEDVRSAARWRVANSQVNELHKKIMALDNVSGDQDPTRGSVALVDRWVTPGVQTTGVAKEDGYVNVESEKDGVFLKSYERLPAQNLLKIITHPLLPMSGDKHELMAERFKENPDTGTITFRTYEQPTFGECHFSECTYEGQPYHHHVKE